MRIILCVGLFLLSLNVYAQSFFRNADVEVSLDGIMLPDAWAGGLNSCQVSTFDANLDGVKDLFIFDRNGGKISVFVNQSSAPGTYDYQYTQAYNDAFPANLRNWVLLRDMNCDGKEDICANSGSGFKIYLNTSSNELSFDSTVNPNIMALYEWDGSAPLTSGVFCISPDVPAIDDYDNDGDMDMWSWNEFSSSLYFYKNMAVENNNCQIPDFKCRNRCYGMFGESVESFTLILGSDFECDFNVINPRDDEGPLRHTGGTTAMFDLDNNGLKDLIIGDVSANSLTAIMLEESSGGQDSAAFVHYDFPAAFGSGFPANMVTFLGSYFIDVNNDEVLDLVVSPNADNDAADQRSLLLYINEGSNTVPSFVEVQDNFLQGGMIDLGVGAYPAAGDVDGDGLVDMVVSNRKRFNLNESFTSRLHFFKNVGTVNAPSFDLTDTNFQDIPSLQWSNAVPALGDLDGDSDADLLVGDLDGLIHYFTNTTQDGIVSFQLQAAPLNNSAGETIDVGQSAAPQIFDVDSDGKNDLLVGCLNGSVFYYRNVGTSIAPVFEWQTDSLGQAVALSLLGIQGKSVPCMVRNSVGETQLLLGTETGPIMQFGGVAGNLQGTFELLSEDFEHIREGSRTAIASADFNNDGLNDLIVGNTGGGLALWTHQPVQVNEWMTLDGIRLFPNPARHNWTIKIPSSIVFPVQMELFNSNGVKLNSELLFQHEHSFSCTHLSSGLYFVRFSNSIGEINKTVIVEK